MSIAAAAALIVAGSIPTFDWQASALTYFDETAVEATISTVAGGGFGTNVLAKLAPMVQPTGVALDPMGRGFYIIDDATGTSLLRFVNTSASTQTIAGVNVLSKNINLISGGGEQTLDDSLARDCDLAQVTGIAISPAGNLVFLATPAFSAIRAINISSQDVTFQGKTVKAGRILTIAQVSQADFKSLAVRPSNGDIYYIAGKVVYRADTGGNSTPYAGGGTPSNGNGDGGPATQAKLIAPTGIVFDTGNNLLISDGGDVRSTPGSVRKVDPGNTISTLASDLIYPVGIGVGPSGDAFVALGNAQQIVRITPAGAKTTIAGTAIASCDIYSNPTCGDGGPATQAYLSIPDSATNKSINLAADGKGVYLPDYRYGRVRFINLSGSTTTVIDTNISSLAIDSIVGSGQPSPYDNAPATGSETFQPTGVAADAQGNLFIADTGNSLLRFVNRTSSAITLFPGTPSQLTVQPGHIVTVNKNNGDGISDENIKNAFFQSPQGLVMLPSGVLIVDARGGAQIKIPPNSLGGKRSGLIRFLNTSNSNVIFYANNATAKIIIGPGQIKDIAGVRPPSNPQTLGDGSTANLVAFYPTDVGVDKQGNIYVADQGNNRIRRIDFLTGNVSTIYGDGSTTTLNTAVGVSFDSAGRLLIADTNNNRVLRQESAGSANFRVIADSTKGIDHPRDLTVDPSGKIYITNSGVNKIIELDAPDNASLGNTSVLAGNGTAGFSGDNGPGSQAKIYLPNPGTGFNDIPVTANITTLPSGDLIFADTNNNRIRMLVRKSNAVPVTSVSAASYVGVELASESITAAFGDKMATVTQTATSTPLPTSLAGTTLKVKDNAGTERLAPLFFVSNAQINYQIPQGTVTGPATITVTSGDGSVSTGSFNVSNVAPGIFTADSSGSGLAAAVILRVKQDGTQIYEAISQYDSGQNKYVAIPIDLGPATDQVFLILFGTGIKFRSSLSAVTATIGAASSEVLYAGPVGGLVGLDQANLRIPRSLIGAGLVDVKMIVDLKQSNLTKVHVK